MTTATEATPAAREERTIAEKKRVALDHLNDAWDALLLAEGVDPDIVAHAALFTALSDLVAAYGEQAVADLAATLPKRVLSFEFSLDVTVQ